MPTNQINKVSIEGSVYQITPSTDGTFTGTSEDSTSPSSWTTVAVLSSGETNGSIFTKISQMFKNIRYLYSKLGDIDISTSGNSITDAISNLETNKADTNHTHNTATTAAAGFMPVLEDDTTKFLRSDGTWVKPAGAEYEVVTTAGPGLAPTLDGDPTKCLLGDGSWGSAGSTYADVTTTASGLMTSTDKVKLDTIDTSANNYIHPTYTSAESGLYKVAVDGEGHVTGATAVAKADITALGIPASDTNTTYATFTSAANGLVPAAKSGTTNYATTGYVLTGAGWATGTKYNTDTNTTYANLKGCTTAAAGTAGLAPAAAAGAINRYLRCDATWQVPPNTNTTYAFSNKGVTLAWNTQSTIATVGGVNITVKMPANPNTNTTYGTNVGCYGSLSGTTLTLNTRNFRV